MEWLHVQPSSKTITGKTGWDVPTTSWEGENLHIYQKSLRIQQIVKFGTKEVDEGKIYTVNR